jgi:hypothetical protein
MHARVGRIVLLGMFGATLTSCGTTGFGGTEGASSPAAILRVCESWPNVTWSSRDTPETIREAKANNAARGGFCQ